MDRSLDRDFHVLDVIDGGLERDIVMEPIVGFVSHVDEVLWNGQDVMLLHRWDFAGLVIFLVGERDDEVGVVVGLGLRDSVLLVDVGGLRLGIKQRPGSRIEFRAVLVEKRRLHRFRHGNALVDVL